MRLTTKNEKNKLFTFEKKEYFYKPTKNTSTCDYKRGKNAHLKQIYNKSNI